MATAPAPVTGGATELVGRLTRALDADSLDLETITTIAVAFGVTLGVWVRVETEEDRESLLGQLTRRLDTLIEHGMGEGFLVRALRDSLDRFVGAVGPGLETSRNRARYRDHFRHMANNPAELDAFIDLLPDDSPLRDKSQSSIQADLQSLASVLRPPDEEDTRQTRAIAEQWRKARQTYLNDDDLDQWDERWWEQCPQRP
jgi:hypothetical protein